MKKQRIALFFLLLSIKTTIYSQSESYLFEINKSGEGEKSIIFIPGFACSGEVWEGTKTKFEKNYTCYLLTMAGFAGVAPIQEASFKNWEESIARFIKNHKIDKPILIGHSMGGGLAMALASDYPELIDKIIVVDALPCLPALLSPTFKSLEKTECSAMTNQLISATKEQFYFMQKMAIKQLVVDTFMQEKVVNWSMKSDRNTFADMYCDFSNTDLRERIKNIKCPTLILMEAYFKDVDYSVSEQYKNLKFANIQYATKGLHFIMYDDKEWYFAQLNQFLTND
jgi:pimeloyl-ACP methyl ester carboxylesterase